MSDAHTFSVRYDEDTLRAAVSTFLLHRWGGFPTLAVFTLTGVGLVAFLLVHGFDGWFAGFVSAILLVTLGLGALTWMLYWRQTLLKFRRLKTPISTFALSDDHIAIANDAGSVTLVWSAIQEILDCGPCWLLVLEGQQFVTLPLRGVGADSLDFVREKVGKFSVIAGKRSKMRNFFP